MQSQPPIRDLAVIGDQRTCAVLASSGDIVWYCPQRFHAPALLAHLLGDESAGVWRLRMPEQHFHRREYVEDSAVLASHFSGPAGARTVTDFMPMGRAPAGICRLVDAGPGAVSLDLIPAPDYGRCAMQLRAEGRTVAIADQVLFGSHPIEIVDGHAVMTVPPGEAGFAALLAASASPPGMGDIETWLAATLAAWRTESDHIKYRGPYERDVAHSLRALRVLTFAESGGIVAAATTSLPEVIGGTRNYDYRYVWLRDAAMIVSALTRAGSDGVNERRFLDYICGWTPPLTDAPLAPFAQVDGKPAPPEEALPLAGYRNSRPVQIGNGARDQLQLDGYANVLLAAKLIYGRFRTREHWSTVERVAEFLAAHWHEPDYGIWEERVPRQHTSSKAIAACALSFIAPYAESDLQARRWLAAADDIREYIVRHCLNADGAYAAIAGGEAVDVSAALFPVWAYTEPDTPEMIATIGQLERDAAEGGLYHRHLEDFDAREEGVFLAGSLWVAQYWIMRHELARARRIIDAVLAYRNDLGLFAEEGAIGTGEMLGNFPQTFVHAALIGAVIDLKAALASVEGT